ncbi:MAG TPA: stage V sporulation protein AB [Firmicutes bacterium]|nr:stage V sporulation protein AB [Bacillota bacterium]
MSVVVLGFAWGLVTGGAMASFLSILEIIPRLAQLTDTRHFMRLYELVIGVTMGSASLAFDTNLQWRLPTWFVPPIGLFMGMYVGLLASALAEVLNVLPVLCRRFDIDEYVWMLIIALILGKVTGSMALWSLPNIP